MDEVVVARVLQQSFLFADTRGSTGYLRDHGLEAASARSEALFSVAEQIVPASGGTIESYGGDGFLAVFPSSAEAVLCAVRLQETVSDSAGPLADLPLGIGVASGDVKRQEGRLTSAGINLAERLCSSAAAKESRVDRNTVDMAGKVPGVSFSPLSEVELKSFGKREYALARKGDDLNLPKPREIPGSALDLLPTAEARSFVETMLNVARQQLPGYESIPGTYYWLAAWPTVTPDDPLALPEIQRAESSLVGAEPTVFNLLRYSDYARWEPDPGYWGFTSHQGGGDEPEYVTWAIDRSATVFHHASQPHNAGQNVATSFLAGYCARAVDLAGRLYESLAITSPVALLIAVSGIQLLSRYVVVATEAERLVRLHDTGYRRSCVPADWNEDRNEHATDFAVDILMQLGATQDDRDIARQWVSQEFDNIDRAHY